MIKNVDDKSIIVKRNDNKKKVIMSGSIVTALVFALSAVGNPSVMDRYNAINTETINIDRSSPKNNREYDVYSSAYLNELNNMDYNQFNNDFINLCKSGKYIIDNVSYDIAELYIVVLEDGSHHLIKAGENHTDIITHDTFSGKNISIMCLRNTSIFYQIFQDGFVSDNSVIISSDVLKQYVDNWDLQSHTETPNLQADKVANEEVRKR